MPCSACGSSISSIARRAARSARASARRPRDARARRPRRGGRSRGRRRRPAPRGPRAMAAARRPRSRPRSSRGGRGPPSPEQQGGVGDVSRQRAGLVERRREGDHPVAGYRAVGRLQADDPAERRRLADRAAGVGADRPRREPAGDGGGGAARGAARDALAVPGVEDRPVARVLVRRPHRELVHVRLPEHPRAGLGEVRDGGRRVRRPVALEDPRAGGRLDALGAEEVLDRDRDAGSGSPPLPSRAAVSVPEIGAERRRRPPRPPRRRNTRGRRDRPPRSGDRLAAVSSRNSLTPAARGRGKRLGTGRMPARAPARAAASGQARPAAGRSRARRREMSARRPSRSSAAIRSTCSRIPDSCPPSPRSQRRQARAEPAWPRG